MTDKSRAKVKKQLLEALAATPIVETACKKAGIGRATYYRWREQSERFEEDADLAIAQGRARINDLAESKLISGVNDGDFRFITYWLKHNKSRYMRIKRELLPFKRPLTRFRFLSRTYDDDG